MLLMIALDVLVPRIAAEATRCRPLAAAALRLMALWATCGRPGLVCPAPRPRPETAAEGRWLGMVVSDTLAEYTSNKSGVNVR